MTLILDVPGSAKQAANLFYNLCSEVMQESSLFGQHKEKAADFYFVITPPLNPLY